LNQRTILERVLCIRVVLVTSLLVHVALSTLADRIEAR
jgi:hypothetical protein